MATPSFLADETWSKFARHVCWANTESLSILLVEKTALCPATVKSHWKNIVRLPRHGPSSGGKCQE
jgi:hypothetical protein